MRYFLTFICAATLLMSCHKHESETPEPTKAERTVIVYMSGDNNLSSYSFPQYDINEMIEGMKNVTGNNNLVIFVDRTNGTEKPFIAKVTNQKSTPVDTLYRYASDFYASDVNNMSEVLKRIASLCPAKEYGLVLWGHASGWIFEPNSTNAPRRAYGVDNGGEPNNYSNRGLWMQIPELQHALAQTGITWKFLFCDCCNMMGTEVAYELRDVAEYLIGAPSEIPGDGAPYNTAMPHFFSTSATFYEGIIDAYAKANPDYLPLSAIKLDQMEALAQATQQVLPLVATYLQQQDAMQGIIYYYAPNGRYNDNYKIMYDAQHVMQTALAAYPDAYAQWLTAFNNAVKYTVKSLRWETMNNNTVNFNDFTAATTDNQGCVSMFIPMAKYDNTTYHFNQSIKQMQWYQAVGWPEVGW